MPSLLLHCAVSRKRTGHSYRSLHQWMDRSYSLLGVNHRSERHYYKIKIENEIKKKWGEEAVVEWLFHIALDNLETAFKRSKKYFEEVHIDNLFIFALDLYLILP